MARQHRLNVGDGVMVVKPLEEEGSYCFLNLVGDIIDFDNDDKKFIVKFRGARPESRERNNNDVCFASFPEDCLKPMTSLSKDSEVHEEFRKELIHKASSSSSTKNNVPGYLKLHLLSSNLYERYVYNFLIYSNNGSKELAKTHPICYEEYAKRALVGFVEATYYGQDHCLSMDGRLTITAVKIVNPFYEKVIEGTKESYVPFYLRGNESTYTLQIIEWCNRLFQNSIAGEEEEEEEEGGGGESPPDRCTSASMLVFKAFSFVRYRIETGKENDNDSLIDVLCVSYYMVRLLSGMQSDVEFTKLQNSIRKDVNRYGSLQQEEETEEFGIKHILWCFCTTFLNAAAAAHHHNDFQGARYNEILPIVHFGGTIAEEIKIGSLLIELRPDYPNAYLLSYISSINIHTSLYPEPTRSANYYTRIFEIVAQGKQVADAHGDPYYRYMFDMIYAFWLPTDICAVPCTTQDIKKIMKQANEFRIDCASYTPDTMFIQGEQHYLKCKAAIKHMQNDLKIPATVQFEKIDTCSYMNYKFMPEFFLPGGESEKFLNSIYCSNCSIRLTKGMCCSKCGLAHYCGKKCQKAHWNKSHKDSCIPRHEKKKVKKEQICDHCSKILSIKLVCSKCNVAKYCGKECQISHWKKYHKNKCGIF